MRPTSNLSPQANRKKSVASFSKAKLAIFVVLNRAHELNLFELGEREGTMEKFERKDIGGEIGE